MADATSFTRGNSSTVLKDEFSFCLFKEENIPWNEISNTLNANIFQTRQWFSYLNKAHGLHPLVTSIYQNGTDLGYFIGAKTSKFGLRILGSPFRGWNSDFMGFCLRSSFYSQNLLKEFSQFAFKEIGCDYLEIVDPHISPAELEGSHTQHEFLTRYVFDLTRSEDDLFAAMDHDRRKNIQKAERCGIVVEQASDFNFAEEYYSQLVEVYAKQSLNPPISKDKIFLLIEELLPTGNLLMLRARNAEGKCIATFIDLALNKTAVGWGAASLKEYQILRPNEALTWFALRYWKAKSMQEYHIGGGWDQYKQSFGCQPVQVARIKAGRNQFVNFTTNAVFSMKNSHVRNWLIRYF